MILFAKGFTTPSKNEKEEDIKKLLQTKDPYNTVPYVYELFYEQGKDYFDAMPKDHEHVDRLFRYIVDKKNFEHFKYFVKKFNLDGAFLEDSDLSGKLIKKLINQVAETGNLEWVKYLLEEKKINPIKHWKPGLEGPSVIASAALSGNLDLVKYLIIERKIIPDKGDGFIMIYAAGSGNVALAKYLMAYDLPLQQTDRSSSGYSVLHAAVIEQKLDMIKFFVEQKKIDINARDSEGQTPLMKVTYNPIIIDYLLAQGADINAKDRAGIRVLDVVYYDKKLVQYLRKKGAKWASERIPFYIGKDDDVKALLQSKDKTFLQNLFRVYPYLAIPHAYALFCEQGKDFFDAMPLEHEYIDRLFLEIVKNKNLEHFKYFVKKFNLPGGFLEDCNLSEPKLPLEMLINKVAETGNLAWVKYLLEEKKIDPLKHWRKGREPYWKAGRGPSIIASAALSGNLDLVKYLVEDQKIIPNKCDDSIMVYAAKSGNVAIARYLAAYDLPLREKSHLGYTVLHTASTLDMLKFFVEQKKLDINIRDFKGRTPLMMVSNPEDDYPYTLKIMPGDPRPMIDYLLAQGADINAKDKKGRCILDIVIQDKKLKQYLRKKGAK